MSKYEENKNFAGIDRQISEFLASIIPSPNNCEVTVKALQNLIFQLIDEKEQALRVQTLENSMKKILEKFSTFLSKDQEIEIKLWLGHNYEQLGAWDYALQVYQDVLALCQTEEYVHQKAEALRWIGHILVMKNSWDEASSSYKESLEICLQQEDQEGEAHLQNALGYLNFEHGNFVQASLYWQNALEIAEKLNKTKLIASFYNNLGILANVQGQWEKALACYGESLPRFEQIGQRRSLAETYHNMAMTYADAERWSEAGSYYEKSYELAKEIGDIRLQAMVKLNRVKLYFTINDYVVAQALCQQALRTFIQLEDHLAEAEVYKYLGILDVKKKKWADSLSYFEKSLAITKDFQNPLGQAETYVEMARMLHEKGEKQKAEEVYKKALEIYSQLELKKDIEKIASEIGELRK